MAAGYAVAEIGRFGGLKLITDPEDIGLQQAIDGQNFELALDLSYVRVRDGLLRVTAANALSGGVNGRCYRLIPEGVAVTNRMIAVSETLAPDTVFVDLVSAGGGVTNIGGFATTSRKFHDAVVLGTPSTNIAFITTEGATLRKVVAGVLTGSVGSPKYVAVSPTSNRLVQGSFTSAAGSPTGANGSTSTIVFSDPGAPETFGANNYEQLRPGDGEEIRGIATWRGQTFVFKESAAFIFSGEGTDSTGQPVFDYRTVTLDGRIPAPGGVRYGPLVGVGSLGVYYLAIDGVYRTTGGPAVRISDAIDDLFRLGSIAPHTLSVVGTRIFLRDETNPAWLVFDERHGQWTRWAPIQSLWDAPLVAWPDAPLAAGRFPTVVAAGAGGTVYYTSPTATTDDGQVIDSSYQSGFDNLGSEAIKVVRQAQVWGTGGVTFSIATDYGTPGAGTAMALGVSPAVADRFDRIARRGTQFSFKLAAVSGAWRVNDIGLHLRPSRPIGGKI